MTKYGWENHDGSSYARQTIQDSGNGVELTVEWVKPEVETDPNHWILRVKGQSFASAETSGSVSDDISLMWYLSTPDDVDTFAKFDTDHITGSDSSFGTYFLAYNEPDTNVSASYTDEQGNKIVYSANYFLAYTVDESD